MVFSSLVFIFVFLPVTIFLYYIAPRKLKNLVLLAASLVFYAWGEPVYITIMLFSTVFDYFNGVLIDKYRGKGRISKLVFINSIVVNIGILSFFKYYGFIVQNLNAILHLNLVSHKLPLPIGISFYTFQTMSYVIDVYLQKVKVQKNIITFGTYITMFPQLVAGPIVRYSDVEEQMDERHESLSKFGEGVEIFTVGLAKKVLLANNIGLLWSTIKAVPAGNLTTLTAWIGIIAFTFQIYFDFSGYSDMAVGLGKMFGFELMKNFNYPYISKSATEFWRRWHISLSQWFREYVYIPLGGNRNGSFIQYRNLIIVWFLTGLWHGASWNFILWGLYYCMFIILEKMFLLKLLQKLPSFISHIYTMLIVVVGWVLFEFENLSSGIDYIKVMFGVKGTGFLNGDSVYYLYTNALLFVLLFIFSTPLAKNAANAARRKLDKRTWIAEPAAVFILILISTAYLVSQTYNPFLYFRF